MEENRVKQSGQLFNLLFTTLLGSLIGMTVATLGKLWGLW